MFYKKIANIPIFILILLFFQPLYNAQNSDLVLSFGEYGTIYISSELSGNALSFCTWLQMEGSFLECFYSSSFEPSIVFLQGTVRFADQALEGAAFGTGYDKAYTVATDCNVKKTDWFHICLTRDQSSMNFYFNGYPLQNYTRREAIKGEYSSDAYLSIGDTDGVGGTNNFYQSNVYKRVITEKEAMDMSNCQSIPGEILSWSNITERSPDITFSDPADLVQKPVPCPNPPKVQRLDCETGEPIEQPGSDPASSSRNPSSSSGNSNQDPGSSSGNPSSSTGNSNQSKGSSIGKPSSSTGNSDQSSGSGASGNPTSPSPNSGTSSQNLNSGSSPGSSGN